MRNGKPPGRLRRMTDAMGLSEPGKTPKPMNQRTAGIFALLFLLASALYLCLSVRSFLEEESVLFPLVMGIIFLIMATVWFLEWRRSKRASRGPGSAS